MVMIHITRVQGYIPLIIIGYNYNSWNEEDNISVPGKTCLSYYPNNLSNVYTRTVVRSNILSRYFYACNDIDQHNKI